MKQSAGALIYRRAANALEVLLVHPSGNYNRHAPWSIPKGLVDPDEQPETTARRELLEETGIAAESLMSLGNVVLSRSRKQIHAFAGAAPRDCQPRAASWEVDRAEFVSIERARQLLHPDQVPLLDRLVAQLGEVPLEERDG